MKHHFHFSTMLKFSLVASLLVCGAGRMWGETVTYTVKSKNSVTTTGTAPSGSSATFVSTSSSGIEQMTSGNSQTLTLSGYNGYSISNITLSMKSNTSGGAGKLSYSIDGSTFIYVIGSSSSDVTFKNSKWNGSYTTTYTNISKDVEITPTTSQLIIKIEATSNSLYCASYAITYQSNPTHTATFSVNGITSSHDYSEWSTITFPNPPNLIGGYYFVGWSEQSISRPTNDTPSYVSSRTMGTNDVTYYAVFSKKSLGEEENASETLNIETKNFPTTDLDSDDYILDGLTYNITKVYAGKWLQWANSLGVIYNQDALYKIQSIVIDYEDINQSITLKIGDTANPTDGTPITPTSEGKVYTFDCSFLNCDYFVLTNGSNASSVNSIVINYKVIPVIYSDYCTSFTTTANLNASGYGTFSSQYPLDFSDYETAGYSAWQITGVDEDNTITFAQITGAVDAGTGLLMMRKGTGTGSVAIPFATEGTNISDTNKLVGITAATAIEDNEYFGLSGNNFVMVNAGTVPAGKALLPADCIIERSNVKPFTFVFERADGIREVRKVSAKETSGIFNLAGQRVPKAGRGIYVINGKKRMMR